jgi:membrane associated rhomboid family serine protease
MFLPLHDDNPRRRVGLPMVTWGLIALNTLIHAVVMSGAVLPESAQVAVVYGFGVVPSVLTDRADLPAHLAIVPEAITPLTYMFLHGGWMHLAGNMLFLWVFGDNVEDAMGHGRFLAFYLLCGVIAGLVFALLGPSASDTPLVGASGAIAGVVAAYLVLFPRVRVWVLVLMRIPLRLTAAWCLGGWVIWQFGHWFLFGNADQVAWLAHIGGLAAGAVLVVLFKRSDVPLFGDARG